MIEFMIKFRKFAKILSFMEFKAKDVAHLLQGVVEGDENVMVNNVSKIEEGKPSSYKYNVHT